MFRSCERFFSFSQTLHRPTLPAMPAFEPGSLWGRKAREACSPSAPGPTPPGRCDKRQDLRRRSRSKTHPCWGRRAASAGCNPPAGRAKSLCFCTAGVRCGHVVPGSASGKIPPPCPSTPFLPWPWNLVVPYITRSKGAINPENTCLFCIKIMNCLRLRWTKKKKNLKKVFKIALVR